MKHPWLSVTTVFLLSIAVFACDDAVRKAKKPGASQAASPPPPLVITATPSEHILFRYRGPAGDLLAADQVSDIPEGSRGEVLVVNMAMAPEMRGSAGWVQVADLRALGKDGQYPVQVLPRAEFERSLRRDALAVGSAPTLVMYATSW